MNYDEASREAVLGARITSNTIGEGWYVDYQFNGWRIVSPNGSHSGFNPTEADEAAEWSIIDMEPPKRVVCLYGATKGGGKSWGLRPVVPAVGWGNPLPTFQPPAEPWGLDSGSEPAATRYAREPSADNVGTPKLSGFELAQLEAKQPESPKSVDKWGQTSKPVQSNQQGQWK